MIRVRAGGAWAAVALAFAAMGTAGCVERGYTIRTIPENALIVVNGEEIGPSPASHSFTFYGDRDIIIMAPGYQTLHVVQPINAPFYDNGLTEFFTENLIPYTFRDERVYTYTLSPSTDTPTPELLGRAGSLRQEAQIQPAPKRRGILGFFGF